jgi:hypothetical protein
MLRSLRALIVEGRPSDAESIAAALQQSVVDLSWVRVDEEADYRRALAASPDIVFADTALPRLDAARALRLLRDEAVDLPFIVVTGEGEEKALGCMGEGADDYLLKNRLGRLGSAVEHALERHRLRAEKGRAEPQAHLEQSRDRDRLLFDANPMPMWVVDLETLAFLAVNDAAVRKYGYAREDFLGRSLRDIAPSEETSSLAERLALVDRAAPAPLNPLASRHRLRDRRLIDVEVARETIRFGGRPAWLTAVNDVTDRARLETELQQAQKMEVVGRLAGGVAHDFNNLLTAISGYTELARDRLAPGDAALDDLDSVQAAATRAAALTRQLLALSRKQPLEPRVVDLHQLITDTDKMLRRLMGEHIHLVLSLAATAPWIRADPGQVGQVLLNLAVNAADAMPHGGTLTIETAGPQPAPDLPAGSSPAPQVRLTVRDTGCGMPPDVLAHLFEPFFTTKAPGRGTGLGLSTVHGIVQQCHGQIAVSSAEGSGTAFLISLPAVTDRPSAAPDPDNLRESPRGTGTILLAEDDPEVRRWARTVLVGAGYTVLEAASAEEAAMVAEARLYSVDLLLTDVVMPGASGRQLAEWLQHLRAPCRALFMSGHTDETIAVRDGGPSDYGLLQKPFTGAELLARVRAALHADDERPKAKEELGPLGQDSHRAGP